MPKKMLKSKKAKANTGKKKGKKAAAEKLIGKIDHIYDKINVVTLTLKNPLKIGDMVRIKGHTTDFVQTVDSIQIEHDSVQKAKKGDGVGIKVKGIVRDNDAIYIASKESILKHSLDIKTPAQNKPAFSQARPSFIALPVLPTIGNNKPATSSAPATKMPIQKPKFLSF